MIGGFYGLHAGLQEFSGRSVVEPACEESLHCKVCSNSGGKDR